MTKLLESTFFQLGTGGASPSLLPSPPSSVRASIVRLLPTLAVNSVCAMVSCPHSNANSIAVFPCRHTSHATPQPTVNAQLTPRVHCACVPHTMVVRVGLAPSFNRCSTVCNWPRNAARFNGVQPLSRLTWSISAPAFTSTSINCVCPLEHTYVRALQPLASV